MLANTPSSEFQLQFSPVTLLSRPACPASLIFKNSMYSCSLTICCSLYEKAVDAYARQSAEKDDVHQAVNFYLLIGKVEEALDLLVKRKLYREAVVLAKLRLTKDDPLTLDVQEKWTQELVRIGNYELAGKM